MRIGLNLLYLLPGIVGGTETYAVGLLGALARIDQENEYVIFLNRESEAWWLPAAPNVRRVVCPVWATNRLGRYVFEQLRLPALLRAYQVDLLHSLGYVAPLWPGCRSVVTVPDLNYQAFGGSMPLHKRLALSFFVGQSVQRSDHLITLSTYVRQEIISAFGLTAERITVTSLAPRPRTPPNQAPHGTADLLADLGISLPFMVAFSSRTPNKNIPRLLQAFALGRQEHALPHQLVLVGHPPDERAATRMQGSMVCFAGFLPDESVQAILSCAALLVFPSIYEGFGLPILEAMAAGVPVACSARAALPEVAGEAALYFDPLSVEDMAGQISRLALDQSLQALLRQRGWDNLARFSWEAAAQQTLRAYRLACHSPDVRVPG
jgi:glycosyltransferase involved in cell wall biosynthesis